MGPVSRSYQGVWVGGGEQPAFELISLGEGAQVVAFVSTSSARGSDPSSAQGKRPGMSLRRSRTHSFTSTGAATLEQDPGLQCKDHNRQRPLPLQCPVRLRHLTPFLIGQCFICSAQRLRGDLAPLWGQAGRAPCSLPLGWLPKGLFPAGGTGAAPPPTPFGTDLQGKGDSVAWWGWHL